MTWMRRPTARNAREGHGPKGSRVHFLARYVHAITSLCLSTVIVAPFILIGTATSFSQGAICSPVRLSTLGGKALKV